MAPRTRPAQARTPPMTPNAGFIEEDPETPPPARARINHLQGQVSELVRKEHVTARKHNSELAEKDRIIASLTAKAKENEGLKRQIKLEGEGMREELNLHSIVAQNKALLAVATEQMQIVEMEQRLLQAEAANIMRDHKMALFKAHEQDLHAEVAEKDIQLAELEAALEEANTSLAHQRAAQTKASKLQESATQKDAELQDEIATLEAKVASLDVRLKSSKEREKDLKEALDEALNEKGAGTDKEKRDLQKALRQAKAELAEAQEELASSKEASKERERQLRAKIRDAHAERGRLTGVEAELEGVRSKSAETTKPKARKAATPSDDSDDDMYKKKSKKESPRKLKAVPAPEDDDVPYKPKVLPKSKSTSVLRDSSDNDKLFKSKARGADEDKEPEKKKKRKLFNAAPPAFTWDPVLNSGDGVIPAYLSPVAKPGKTASGTIPRAGFSSMATSRSLGKF